MVEGEDPVTGIEHEDQTTHNRMELLAVVTLLEQFPDKDIHIYCDSMAVVTGFANRLDGWARKNYRRANGKPVAHKDLWKKLNSLRKDRKVIIEYVRGHSGHHMNEIADKAVGEARKIHEQALGNDEGRSGP